MKVTIPIFKSFYDIECENEQKENIEKISRQINKEITKLAKITNINDEKTLLLLYCIELNNIIIKNNNEEPNQKIIENLTNNLNNLTNQINLITNKVIEQL